MKPAEVRLKETRDAMTSVSARESRSRWTTDGAARTGTPAGDC